jgi:hypothetical protein
LDAGRARCWDGYSSQRLRLNVLLPEGGLTCRDGTGGVWAVDTMRGPFGVIFHYGDGNPWNHSRNFLHQQFRRAFRETECHSLTTTTVTPALLRPRQIPRPSEIMRGAEEAGVGNITS